MPSRPSGSEGTAPAGVTAVLENGLRILCEIHADGMDTEGYPKYRITAEVDWRRFQITRVEVTHWPDGTALALVLPHSRQDEAVRYAAHIQWIDLQGRDAV